MGDFKIIDRKFTVDNETFYPVTDVQRYWVDDNIDQKYKKQNFRHGIGIETFEITGDFDADVLRQAVLYTVKRHESLRCTFCQIDGQFFMKVFDEHPAVFEFKDLTGVNDSNIDIVNDFVDFVGHSFIFGTDPLFFVRLVQTERNRFVLSFKVHHVIFDAWSEAILISDLYTAYHAFSQKKMPAQPPLMFQYKDCLEFLNELTRTNAEADRAYWSSLYVSPPPKLTIPGVNADTVKEDISQRASFMFSDNLSSKLAVFAREFSTSMFVILQASFKAFLFCCAGQRDILIGTAVFGREWPGFEDQIGCYAKTMAIRTILNETTSFNEVIEKVKKSTEDMNTHTTISLRRFLSEQSPENATERWHKINVQYMDDSFENLVDSNSPSGDLQFTFKARVSKRARPSVIAIDMQIEFSKSKNGVGFQVVYDKSLYSQDSIYKLFESYIKHTDLIASAPGRPISELLNERHFLEA